MINIKERLEKKNKLLAIFWEYTSLLVTALVLASAVRGIWFEPFKIPSTSMVPTLLVGDFLFVDKNNYGLRNPCSGHRYFYDAPKRGDVVVFQKKKGPLCGTVLGLGSLSFIKRIVAVPGDRIAYFDKKLYVNGKEVPTLFEKSIRFEDGQGYHTTAKQYDARMNGVHHKVLTMDDKPALDVEEAVVPEGQFAVMGDNRDNSLDSRYMNYPKWTFIDMADIVGQAKNIFWSWDTHMKPRFKRIGTSLVAEHLETAEVEEE